MTEVLIISPNTTEQELLKIKVHCAINPVLACLITQPIDMSLARQFECDIIPVWNATQDEIYDTAQLLSTKSDALIVVIGATC